MKPRNVNLEAGRLPRGIHQTPTPVTECRLSQSLKPGQNSRLPMWVVPPTPEFGQELAPQKGSESEV